MSYIGNSPALKYASFAVQHFTTSATTGYTLDNAVTNENDIRLVINNVVQQPGGSYAYTASGTTLTLSAATTSSDTMYCVFIGKAVQTVVPPDGSVDSAQLATDAVTQAKMADDSVGTAEILDDNVTTAKILDTNVTGAKLNDDVISGQGALGAAPADTDEFLVSDAGTLKRVDYSYIKGITQTSFLPDALPIIKNGSMDVAQRGTSATGITGDEYGTCDRWKTSFTTLGTWTQTQEGLSAGAAYTTGGFRSSLKMDNTTADASPAAGDRGRIIYQMEGYDAQAFKKGTASAEAFTIAFWIKATKTGTNIVEIYDNDAGRHCCTAYTVSSTDTWEHKILNFPADTTGAIALSNASKLTISFYLGAGTNYTSGTLATTWAAAVSANRAVGQVNNADSTSNNWEITGVQMEVGEYTSSDLPPFRFESFGANLARCKRYYERLGSGFSGGSNSAGNNVDGSIAFSVAKRSTSYSGSLQATSSVIAKPAIAGYNLSALSAIGQKGSYGCYMSLSPDGSVATETYITGYEVDWLNIDDEL